MIKINKVSIENFQSHKNTILVFEDGLNVITGPSDQGKSAIIRAIKWVLYNEPRGNDFIRNGTTFSKVSIEFTNGFTVIRERSKSKNRYTVINSLEESEVFEGFGNEVPLEIVKVSGISQSSFNSNISTSLNIGNQLEGPFLLSETGAIRAKALGALIGLDIIDKSIKDTIVDLRRENQNAERIRNELNDISEKLNEYENLEEIKERLDKTQNIINVLKLLTEKKNKLENLKYKIQSYKDELYEISKTLEGVKNLERCKEIVLNSEVRLRDYKLLFQLNTNYRSLENDRSKLLEQIDKTKNIEYCENILNLIYEKKEKYDKLEKAYFVFKKLNNEISNLENVLKNTVNFEKQEELFKDLSLKKEKHEKYLLLSKQIARLDKEISEIKNANISKFSFEKGTNYINRIEEISSKLQKLKHLKKIELELEKNINEGVEFIKKNSKEINIMLKKYSEYLKAMGKCPLCSSLISDEKINKVIQIYQEGS